MRGGCSRSRGQPAVFLESRRVDDLASVAAFRGADRFASAPTRPRFLISFPTDAAGQFLGGDWSPRAAGVS